MLYGKTTENLVTPRGFLKREPSEYDNVNHNTTKEVIKCKSQL
jgi:hypothetical protein